MDNKRRKITIIALAILTWVLIPLFGLAALDAANETGIPMDQIGTNSKPVVIAGYLEHAKSLLTKDDPGKDKNSFQGHGIDSRPSYPELGSFFLLGTGLLTLAGWGKRKFRK